MVQGKMLFKCTILLLLVVLHSTLADDNDLVDFSALFGETPRSKLNFPDLVRYDGYEVENHTIITSDGYIMDMFRLPVKDTCPPGSNKVPILFMHGLYLSGDDCIIPGPGNAHCYIYADNCYDVWVPNIRGNRYGRNHIILNPDTDPEFWNFAVDEMALIDLPAFIDYILAHTSSSQLNFVGHSQGAGMLLMLCAKKPEYNDKIKVAFGLSFTAWLEHARFVAVAVQGVAATLSDPSNNKTNFEIFRYGGFIQKSANAVCGLTPLEYPLCSVLIFALLGYNKFQITDKTLRVIVGHQPGGTSYKDFIRWGQMRNYGFCEYDYGTVENLLRYGQTKPPLIDLSNVTMTWHIIGSENDYVGDLRDIDTLKSHLKSEVHECVLADKTYGHLDFIYGKDIPNYITPKVLSVMGGGSFDCP